MKNLITHLSECLAAKYAHITDDNEMYYITEEEIEAASEDLRDKRIAELEATIKSMQEELKLLKDDNKSMKEVINKQKRSEAAKKAAATRAARRAAAEEVERINKTPSSDNYGGCWGGSWYSRGGC